MYESRERTIVGRKGTSETRGRDRKVEGTTMICKKVS